MDFHVKYDVFAVGYLMEGKWPHRSPKLRPDTLLGLVLPLGLLRLTFQHYGIVRVACQTISVASSPQRSRLLAAS